MKEKNPPSSPQKNKPSLLWRVVAITWIGLALTGGLLIFHLAEFLFFSMGGLVSLGKNLGFTIILLLAAYGVGKKILSIILGSQAFSRLHALASIGLGFGVLSYIVFLAASLKLLYAWVLWPVLVILLALGFREIIPAVRSSVKYLAGLPLKLSSFTLAELVILCLLVTFLLTALLLTLTPPQRYDSLVYHLQVPKLFLEAHGFERIPSNLYSNLYFNFDLVYGLALALSSDISAKLIHYLFGILLVIAIYDFTLSVGGRRFTGLLASLLYALSPLFLFEITSAYIELFLSFYLFLALICGIRFSENRERGWLLLAAILCGVALGGKNTAVAQIAALGVLVLFWSGGLKPALRNGLMFGLVVFLFILPWLLKNYILMKNPFYPFLSSFFGTVEWDQTILDRYLQFQRLLYTCTAVLAGDGLSAVGAQLDRVHLGFLFPVFQQAKRILLTVEFNAIPPPLAIALAPLYFFLPVRNRRLNLAWAFFFLSLPMWAISAPRARFLLPILMMVSISGALSIVYILDRIRNRGLFFMACFLIVLSCLMLFPYELNEVGDDIKFVTGRMSRGDYLESIADRPGTNNMNDILFLNRNTPARARIFMIADGRGYYLERKYIGDSYPSVSYTRRIITRCGDEKGFYEWLSENGFTHIYYDRDVAAPDPSSCLLEETLLDFRLADEIYERFKKDYAKVLNWNPDSGVEILEVIK